MSAVSYVINQMQWMIYLFPMLIIWKLYYYFSNTKTTKNTSIKKEAISTGMTEPASLHPVINPSQCIGCATCVSACPEAKNNVLGVIHGKAELINPTHCIGHGACKTACPVGAITLVFGTEKRGIDIPHVQPNFETNIKDIFIAGELGGMGLIRNAVEQGKQAMTSIIKKKYKIKEQYIGAVIVGAGPAGIAASLSALDHGLPFVTIEQDSLGGTVAHFPRGKLVMTAPVNLPIYGKVNFKETTKEKLLELWEKVVEKTGLMINFKERVESIEVTEYGFKVLTNKAEYLTHAVLLAIGRRGTPRKLGAKGEEQNKVVYRLIDPEQYVGQHVLVVGGGDSALEAAVSIAEQANTTVTISYRSPGFSRAKEKNRQKVQALEDQNRLQVLLESTIDNIGEHDVTIKCKENNVTINNQAVIICAGGILPTGFLKEIGINVETKHGTA
jgi:thioredoxin reductase/Pyruvate/2-oxoacid:ferredoxin oxidoreductase delta subunit